MSNNLDKLLAKVEALADKHSRPDWATQLMMPLLCLMSFGLVSAHAPRDTYQLKLIKMDDDWLGVIAAEPAVSKEGLKHLATALERQGFVTLFDAAEWAKIERKALNPKPPEALPTQPTISHSEGKGADSLRERAMSKGVYPKRFLPTVSEFAKRVTETLQGKDT